MAIVLQQFTAHGCSCLILCRRQNMHIEVNVTASETCLPKRRWLEGQIPLYLCHWREENTFCFAKNQAQNKRTSPHKLVLVPRTTLAPRQLSSWARNVLDYILRTFCVGIYDMCIRFYTFEFMTLLPCYLKEGHHCRVPRAPLSVLHWTSGGLLWPVTGPVECSPSNI